MLPVATFGSYPWVSNALRIVRVPPASTCAFGGVVVAGAATARPPSVGGGAVDLVSGDVPLRALVGVLRPAVAAVTDAVDDVVDEPDGADGSTLSAAKLVVVSP